MNLWTALVAIAAIWGVVEVFRQWAMNKRKSQAGDEHRVSEQAMRELRQRIETLERIVTDDKEALRRKFDELQ